MLLGSLCNTVFSIDIIGVMPEPPAKSRYCFCAAALKESNLVYGGANAKFGVKVGEGQISARAGYDFTRRTSSTIGETTLAFGYERKSGTKFEMGVKSQTGNRKDVPDTKNFVAQEFRGVNKNDKLIFMEFSYGF